MTKPRRDDVSLGQPSVERTGFLHCRDIGISADITSGTTVDSGRKRGISL